MLKMYMELHTFLQFSKYLFFFPYLKDIFNALKKKTFYIFNMYLYYYYFKFIAYKFG